MSLLRGARLTLTPEAEQLLQESEAANDRELNLQTASLLEAEAAKEQAEAAQVKLQTLNEQLQQKQALTEEQLIKEQEYRLQQNKTDFQRQFALVLVGLIAFSLVLPYLGSWFGATEKTMDGTSQLSLLLVQTLAAVSAFLYARRREDGTNGG